MNTRFFLTGATEFSVPTFHVSGSSIKWASTPWCRGGEWKFTCVASNITFTDDPSFVSLAIYPIVKSANFIQNESAIHSTELTTSAVDCCSEDWYDIGSGFSQQPAWYYTCDAFADPLVFTSIDGSCEAPTNDLEIYTAYFSDCCLLECTIPIMQFGVRVVIGGDLECDLTFSGEFIAPP